MPALLEGLTSSLHGRESGAAQPSVNSTSGSDALLPSVWVFRSRARVYTCAHTHAHKGGGRD